ncbi:hypothetical protein BH11BAC5_BH11BAC5_55430 [soil metagenome]
MVNLERFFEIQFDDKEISRQNLRKFTEDHIQRVAAQNTANQYDQMLNDTETKYNSFFGALNDHDTSFALQQSRTKSMNNVMESFIKKVQQRGGLITNSYDEESPEYQEFYPNGKTEYTNANLQNVETLMTRFIAAATAHVATLGNALAVEFTGLLSSFTTARGSQLSQKGLVSAASDDTDTARHALEIQLTKNLLNLALLNIGNTNAAAIFFDQSIIRSNGASVDDTPAP